MAPDFKTATVDQLKAMSDADFLAAYQAWNALPLPAEGDEAARKQYFLVRGEYQRRVELANGIGGKPKAKP